MDAHGHPHPDMSGAPYPYYQEEQPQTPYMHYNQMGQYQVPVAAPAPLAQPPHAQFHPSLGLIQHSNQYHGYPPSSPPHVPLQIPGSPPPPSPDMYDPLSPPLSGSDTSADGHYPGSNSSGQNSPASSRAPSLVHRHRYDPTPSPTGSIGSQGRARRRGRSQDSDEDDMSLYHNENLANNRKEATRKQRIEAEQRRRDELRDGYAKLKEVLPVSNQKSSKVSLLDRATHHIVHLEGENKTLQDRIASLEDEIRRLHSLNDKLAGGSMETPSPGMYEAGRPLSPPPDLPPSHVHHSSSLAGATIPRDDASSGSSPSDDNF